MKKLALAALVLLVASPAIAQQTSPHFSPEQVEGIAQEARDKAAQARRDVARQQNAQPQQQAGLDATALAYRQLLHEADDRIAGAANQIQILTKQVEELKAAAAKAPAPEQPKKQD